MPKTNTQFAVILLLLAGAWTWSHAQSKNTLTLQDYNDITQLYARYNHAIDSVDAEGLAALFTSDGSVSFHKGAGHDELVDMVNNSVGLERNVSYVDPKTGKRATTKRHWNSGLVITGSPEGAKGSVYLLAVNVGQRPPVLMSASQYDDTLIKTPQGWKFQRRNVLSDGPPAGVTIPQSAPPNRAPAAEAAPAPRQ